MLASFSYFTFKTNNTYIQTHMISRLNPDISKKKKILTTIGWFSWNLMKQPLCSDTKFSGTYQ